MNEIPSKQLRYQLLPLKLSTKGQIFWKVGWARVLAPEGRRDAGAFRIAAGLSVVSRQNGGVRKYGCWRGDPPGRAPVRGQSCIFTEGKGWGWPLPHFLISPARVELS